MQWHSIYSGPTTTELRQILARRSEFYFTDDHEAVIGLVMDKIGYLVHVSTVIDAFGWSRNRAIRVLEEIAEAFQLPTGTVNSPYGENQVYMWGKVIESGTWPVSAGEEEASYSPVLGTVSDPVPVPVSTPAPVPAPPTDVEAAARRALNGTKLSKIEAAKGLISYGVKELGMTAEAVADTLILMSRSESTGLTRATLQEWVNGTEPAKITALPTEDEVEVEFSRAQRAGELAMAEADHPELAVGVAVVRELNEARPFQPVDLEEIRHWDQEVRGNIRDPKPEEVTRAVREALDGYTGILGVDYVGRIMRRHREEQSVEARRARAMFAGSAL